jgi:hypothetical protein
VEYNWGLSGTFYGDVKHIKLDSAKQIFRNIWTESHAGSIADSCMALVYFDTYVVFTPTAAKDLLSDCYDPRSYLLKRLALHMENLKSCPIELQRKHLIAWNRRIVDLFRICGQ